MGPATASATTLKEGPLRVLVLEDNPADAELSLRELRRHGFGVTAEVVGTREEFFSRLQAGGYDLVLADHRLPGCTGLEALAEMRRLENDIPFILVTGSLGEEAAVECIKQGAADYVLKDRLARLPVAVRRALDDQRLRQERARAEAERARLMAAIEQASEAVVITDPEGRIEYVNPAFTWITGYAREEAVGQHTRLLKSGQHPPEFYRLLWETIRSGKVWYGELTNRRKDGSLYPQETSITPVRDARGEIRHFIALMQDVTERKRADEAVRRATRALRALSACNMAIVRARQERELLDEICRIVVEKGGYRLAWVGFAEADEQRSVRPVAVAGQAAAYARHANVTWADTERGRGPVGRAIRGGRAAVVRDVATDPDFAPRRAEAQQHGFGSVIALPLLANGRPFGALAIYAAEANVFDAEEEKLLEEMAGDLAFGLTVLRTRAEREQATDALRELSGRLLAVQDEERRRLARELHDTTSQTLAALVLNVSSLRETAGSAPLAAGLATCQELAEQSAREIRTFSYLLHPPLLEEMGLVSALRAYVEGFTQRSGIAVELEAPPVETRFPAELELALFRVAQESLANVHRHSGSRRARLCFAVGERDVRLEVSDEGRGLLPEVLEKFARGGAELGVGLAGMRERLRQLGGRLEVLPEKPGTTVRATLPLPTP